MSVNIYLVGKLKNALLGELVDDYVTRIRRFAPCQVHVLKEAAYRDEKKYAKEIIESEGKTILSRVATDAHCVLLERKGQSRSSMDFSYLIDRLLFQERRQIAFVIGGFLGVSEAVLQRADTVLSLSEMTFTHEIAALLLTEQIFRALTIARHIPYHK